MKNPRPNYRQLISEIRVYYADTDASGVVYHGNYLRMAEACRSDFLRSIGIPLVSASGESFVAVEANTKWMKPSYLDDLLVCDTKVVSIRGARISVDHIFWNQDAVVCNVSMILAYIDAQFRPSRIRGALEAAFLVNSDK